MFKYRKKPVVIEAFQFTGPFSAPDVPQWYTDAFSRNEVTHSGDWESNSAHIKTLEGAMRADKGDWIIRGVKGELYPCKPDIFAATYEPVSEDEEAQSADTASPLAAAVA